MAGIVLDILPSVPSSPTRNSPAFTDKLLPLARPVMSSRLEGWCRQSLESNGNLPLLCTLHFSRNRVEEKVGKLQGTKFCRKWLQPWQAFTRRKRRRCWHPLQRLHNPGGIGVPCRCRQAEGSYCCPGVVILKKTENKKKRKKKEKSLCCSLQRIKGNI